MSGSGESATRGNVGRPPGATEAVRVLHADDEASFAELVATFLERREPRIDVTTATSASEGLSLLGERPFDCVVSDHDMPDRNGIEFLEAVREGYPDLPFILFTGKGSEEIASLAISAGVDDYLQKEGGTEQYTVLANRVMNYVERARGRAQRRRLLAAIESTRDGVALLDADGEYVYVNDAYGSLYGVDPAEVVGRHWTDVFPDTEASFLDEVVRPTLEAEGYWEGESTVHRADGSTFVAERAATVTASGEVVWSVRDVTDRKRRERALSETNRQLEAVLDTVEAAIIMKDTEGRYLLMNQNVRELVGLDDDVRVVGKTDYEIFPAELAERYRADDRRTLESGETQVVEEPVPGPEGERIVLTRKSPVFDEHGEPYAVCAVATDITERKHREEELLETSERLGTVVSNLPVVLFVLDPSGEFTLSDGKGLEALGLEPGEVVGRSVFDVYGWHEGIVEATERALDGAFVEDVYTIGELVFDTTFQPVFDDDGAVSKVIGVAVDVTKFGAPDRV